MPSPYKDRLDIFTYADDSRCEIRLQRPIVNSMSEKLLGRLRSLATAHELLLLASLPIVDTVAYPQQRLDSLEEELAFLFEILSDTALLDAVAPLQEMIGRALHDRRGWTLEIEARGARLLAAEPTFVCDGDRR